jgi:cGMP-dependent protein kinase
MFYGVPRWATMTALERSDVWVLSQSTFRTVQMQIATESAKSAEDCELISEALAVNGNFRNLVKLGKEHIDQLVQMAWVKSRAKGEVEMKEGDLNADAFYIIGGGEWEFRGTEPYEVVTGKGRLNVAYLSRAAHTGERLTSKLASGQTETVMTLQRGLCFGEITMLYCAPRFCTVTAKTDGCYLLAIDRASFQAVQMKASEDEILSRVNHLSRLTCFNQFGQKDKQKFAGIMEKMRLHKGDYIVKKGETNTALYILQEGKVEYTRGDGKPTELEADPNNEVVHFFGSDALVMDDSGDNEVAKVVSEDAMALVLEQSQFEKICDRLVEAAPAPAFTRYATTMSKVGPKDDGLTFDNLVRGGLLGVSSLGPVELCRHKMTKELYAVKSLDKGLIVQKGLRKSIMTERTLCTEVLHPNIIRSIAFLAEPQTLHFVMEAALGGELSTVFKREELFGSVRHTRHYVACVILALDHLHQRRIIYRNLKPKNILLSQQGHPKLTDMSISKLVVSNTFTTCGTPMYMAPEVVAGIGHNRAADWWSLGVLIFELMSGTSPFQSDHPMEIYSKVMRGVARVSFPPSCQGVVKDLIMSLLMPKAVDRLPMKQGGVQRLLDHEWFASFPWALLRSQHLEPPYVPRFQVPQREWKDLQEDKFFVYLAHYSPDKSKIPRSVEYKVDDLDDPDWDAGFFD